MKAATMLPFLSLVRLMTRIGGVLCTLALLADTAFADVARQLRIEAGVLIHEAETAESAQARRILLEEAHGRLLEIQERFPDRPASLTLYLSGRRVSLSLIDVAAMIEDSPFAEIEVGRLREVLGRHLSPTAVDENGWTDLHWAAVLNRSELAKALIDAGADVEAAVHSDGEHFSDRLQKLVDELDLDPELPERRNGQQPLHFAAVSNAAETMTFLFSAGAEVDANDHHGFTPLHYAAGGNNAMDAVAALIDHGADVKHDVRGWTPLHSAAWGNEGDAVALLVERGADVNAKNDIGWTPLHAAAHINAGDSATILIERGAYVNAKDNDRRTPFEVAIGNNSLAVVEILRKSQ